MTKKKTTKKRTSKPAAKNFGFGTAESEGFENGPTEVDPESFFEGFEEESVVSLNDGEGLKGVLVGPGNPLTWQLPDGSMNEVDTWKIKIGALTLRLMGGAILNKELTRIMEDYVSPCFVAIFRVGKRQMKNGREITDYRIGAKGKKTKPDEIPF